MAGRSTTRPRALGAGGTIAVALGLVLGHPPAASAETCGRGDFEMVVQEAASALNALNQKNKPAMQERLRMLRDKRGWSQELFNREAAPFVRDEATDVFDRRSEELLGKITAMGQDGATSEAPDCRLLADLKGAMQGLVGTQSEKWAYLFAKLDAALAK